MTPYWDSLLADPLPEVKLCFWKCRRVKDHPLLKHMVWDFSLYLIECPGEDSSLAPGITGAGREMPDVPDA